MDIETGLQSKRRKSLYPILHIRRISIFEQILNVQVVSNTEFTDMLSATNCSDFSGTHSRTRLGLSLFLFHYLEVFQA